VSLFVSVNNLKEEISLIHPVVFRVAESNFKNLFEEQELHLLVRIISENFLEGPTLPSSRESVAVAFNSPKIAALCYDRVWGLIRGDHNIPQGIFFNTGSTTEIELIALALLQAGYEYIHGKEKGSHEKLLEAYVPFVKLISEGVGYCLPLLDRLARRLTEDICTNSNLSVTAFYSSEEEKDLEYKPGKYEVIISILKNLQVVQEDEIEWAQVLEFRRDANARIKFGRFVHWLDGKMIGKSRTYIEQEISSRLEDYEWAIRKHGLKTALGTIQTILDSKVLAGSSAALASLSLAGEPLLGMVAGASIFIGNLAVKIGNSLVDLHDQKRQDAEIAFIHETREKLKPA